MGGGGGGGAKSSSSVSSGEEDGDAKWRAAIESVAAADFSGSTALRPAGGWKSGVASDGEKPKTPGLKLYQIKAKKLLDDLLEKNIEIVRTPGSHLSDTAQSDGGGIKLFRKAPPGITLDTIHILDQIRSQEFYLERRSMRNQRSLGGNFDRSPSMAMM